MLVVSPVSWRRCNWNVLEADVVRPFNPPFYDRYVDDCFSKKKKDEPDALFERLYLNCSVFKKPGKLPTHQCRLSETFYFAYNQQLSKRLATRWNIIPNFLFEEQKKVFIKLPFCGKNEKLSKTFIEKLNKFTNFNFIFVILWQTRQIKTLFNNKDKNTHRSKVVYKGDCSCGVDYIGETVRNLAVRIAEHSNPAHTSEPAKHLRENPSHSFTWRVLSSAQTPPFLTLMMAYSRKRLV